MSFMERYRSGELPAGAIEDYIREWHVSDLAPSNLLEHLGLSSEEYTRWEQYGELPVIDPRLALSNQSAQRAVDPAIETWTDRMQAGTKQMATDEEARKAIAKKLF